MDRRPLNPRINELDNVRVIYHFSHAGRLFLLPMLTGGIVLEKTRHGQILYRQRTSTNRNPEGASELYHFRNENAYRIAKQE